MPRSKDPREKRLAELKKEVTRRGFDRYPSVLKNISELSCELQSPSIAALVKRKTVETIISFPPQIQRGWSYVPKQALVFTPTDIIHILASIWPNQEPQVTSIRASALLYMNISLILLYGYLEIVAQNQNSPVRISMEFNTVAWSYLSMPLRQFLNATQTPPALVTDKSTYSLTAHRVVEQLPTKFSNGISLYGLLPGEELQDVVFQPRTWKRWLHFFQTPFSPNILLMLTSNYVVVIQEELNIEQGWVLSYIPRSHILEIQNHSCELSNTLSIQLQQGSQCTAYDLKLLKNETVQEWHQQWIQHNGQWHDFTQ